MSQCSIKISIVKFFIGPSLVLFSIFGLGKADLKSIS